MADRGEFVRILQITIDALNCVRFYLMLIEFFVTGDQQQHGLEVLAFPEQPEKEFSTSELLVPCILCDREFPDTKGKNDAVLHHLLVEHQLVIGDVAQVCDMRRYGLSQEYQISLTDHEDK